MKHFANFAPSYNNIGLGIGAAVGLARGSGLIGESQEERDNTTGLGRLGKLAGYTGGGVALGAGTGMAVKAGTNYIRGRKTEPRPQNHTTSAEPWDNDWTKSQSQRQTPEVDIKNPSGYSGLSEEARQIKLRNRKQKWGEAVDRVRRNPDPNINAAELRKQIRNDTNLSEEQKSKSLAILGKERNYNARNIIQSDIDTGNYVKSDKTTRNF